MKLPDCPLPQLDFDVITLSHGSGGLLTNRLLNECIFKVLDNEHLALEDDGAILDLSGKIATTTDSFVVSPIFFPGGNIGDLAVHGTVNDIAMCGAIPNYLSLGMILEEGLKISELWDVLVSIRNAAYVSGVQIVTGDTKVVDRGKGDKIFINTTGLGVVHPRADLGIHRIATGDVVIASGPIATHGMAILSVRQGLEFESQIQSDTAPVARQVELLLDAFGNDIHFMRDPTRGGVATVLNEVARKTGLCVELQENSLPVLDPVQNLCEILGIDPLYVANEGIFIAIVSREIAKDCIDIIRKGSPTGMPSIIGEVVANPSNCVVLKSNLGGRRVVHMPVGEQLPRIC